MGSKKTLRWESQTDALTAGSVVPDCFSQEEWRSYYNAGKEAVWSKNTIDTALRKSMCEDCTLVYQYRQIKEGKCKPHYGVATPIHRLASVLSGESVESETETPWPDLPVLPREGV